MMKNMSGNLIKKLHVLWQRPDWVKMYNSSFKLETEWKKGRITSSSCTHLDVKLFWWYTETMYSFTSGTQASLRILLSINRFVTLFLFFPSFRSLPVFLVSSPCPLSFHLPGRSNSESMESRDAAEGIFERELWLQTFHLVLYLAKAGCRVPWLSEDIHSMREDG